MTEDWSRVNPSPRGWDKRGKRRPVLGVRSRYSMSVTSISHRSSDANSEANGI